MGHYLRTIPGNGISLLTTVPADNGYHLVLRDAIRGPDYTELGGSRRQSSACIN